MVSIWAMDIDALTFRFNRRNSRYRGKLFYRLMQQAVAVEPTTYREISPLTKKTNFNRNLSQVDTHFVYDTSMPISKLISIAPPPSNPINNSVSNTKNATEKGFPELPPDYLEFIKIYGECSFYKHIFILSPYRDDAYSLFEWRRSNSDQLKSLFSGPLAKLNNNVLPLLPISIYPESSLESNGLLLCGGDNFGEFIAWITQGPPEKWRTAYFNVDLFLFSVYDMNITEFLLKGTSKNRSFELKTVHNCTITYFLQNRHAFS